MSKKSNRQIFAESFFAATVLSALLGGAIAAIYYYGWIGFWCVFIVCIYFWMIDSMYENGKKTRDGDNKNS